MSSLRVFNPILLNLHTWVQREALDMLLSNNFCANREFPLYYAFRWEGPLLENSIIVWKILDVCVLNTNALELVDVIISRKNAL